MLGHSRRQGCIALMAVALWPGGLAWGQHGTAGIPGSAPTGQGVPPGLPGGPLNDETDAERSDRLKVLQEKARNDDRQKRLVADTDRLLALATELKASVDKTNKDLLSVDVVRKADEIEKLAHSVKEKMKGS